jgi:hypothetical protein
MLSTGTTEEGLARLLVNVMLAKAAPNLAKAQSLEADYTPLETAVLELRWLGEALYDRGGVQLMRQTLEGALEGHSAAPWLRACAEMHFDGIGTWSARPAPVRGPMA